MKAIEASDSQRHSGEATSIIPPAIAGASTGMTLVCRYSDHIVDYDYIAPRQHVAQRAHASKKHLHC